MDDAEDIMTSRDRKERKWLFKAINDGNYEDLSMFTVASKCSEPYSQRLLTKERVGQDARKINLHIFHRSFKSNGRKIAPRKQQRKRSVNLPS